MADSLLVGDGTQLSHSANNTRVCHIGCVCVKQFYVAIFSCYCMETKGGFWTYLILSLLREKLYCVVVEYPQSDAAG